MDFQTDKPPLFVLEYFKFRIGSVRKTEIMKSYAVTTTWHTRLHDFQLMHISNLKFQIFFLHVKVVHQFENGNQFI
jgi:hypothetical protein